jgi:hypothetical protein
MRISLHRSHLSQTASAVMIPLLLSTSFAVASRRPRATHALPADAGLSLPPSLVAPASQSTRTRDEALLTVEATVPLRLQSAAFPSQPVPGALAYVPAGVDTGHPLHVVVFFHGWNGCAAAVASDEQIPCRPGGPRRGSLDLIGQFRASGRAAVLLIPQLGLETQRGDPGQLGARDGLRRFLDESLTALAPQLGAHRVDELASVSVVAHSGGYEAAYAVLRQGGVEVQRVAFFDATYTGIPTLAGWLRPSLENPFLDRRFVSVFGRGAAGAGSRQLQRLLRADGHGGEVFLRSAPGRVTEDDLRRPVSLLHSDGDHQQVLRRNLVTVLRAMGLPAVPPAP